MANSINIGRRKDAVARVYLTRGTGTITINKREFTNFFPNIFDRQVVLSPLETLSLAASFDIHCNVNGGGTTGQAGAIRHAIARALVELDEANRPSLRKEGHMTRDPRMVERKKYGLKKARRRFQFSKR